jgi:MFS family permease
MLNILSNRTYRHLFMAQVIALIGTGLATVALGLLAYDLAGDRAGAVLGTALAIKMSAYILVAPVAAAFADKFPRRTMLVTSGSGSRSGICAAVRHPDLGNLYSDLRTSVCLGGVHANFPGNYPGYSS